MPVETVPGKTSEAFSYIYIKQGKYNKLALTGEAEFSIYGAESLQNSPENRGEVLRL